MFSCVRHHSSSVDRTVARKDLLHRTAHALEGWRRLYSIPSRFCTPVPVPYDSGLLLDDTVGECAGRRTTKRTSFYLMEDL